MIDMTVKIGHARIDENGKAKYGRAGDQTGKEVVISDWYLHPKKWYVLRCKDVDKREKIAQAMEKACKNSQIGYDQSGRYTLFNNVKDKGFDPSKTTKPVETDCSELTRVCIAYAYGKDVTGVMRTDILPTVLVKTGLFTKYTSKQYCQSSAYLRRGDILCTRSQGHVVVVLSDGAMVEDKLTVDGVWAKDTTRKTQKVLGTYVDGIVSNQPEVNKKYLPAASTLSWEFKTEDYADGSSMVKAIQKLVGSEPDGWCGKNTVKAIQQFLKKKGFYTGLINGKLNKATVQAWQNYINSRL
jgi:hypothetical protein